jgi:signal-transduction protein with cAMP-binding, CBS, and nucleotidyltransferase domain
MSVERICTLEVDTAERHESVFVTAERMHQRTVGTLIVVNENKEPIGIVSDRDLVVRVIAKGKDPQTTMVGEVMTPCPEMVPKDMVIEDALALMRHRKVRRLPVVDDQGKLVGLLTLDDVMMLLTEELGEVGQLLQRQTPRAAAGV